MTKLPATMNQPISEEKRAVIFACAIIVVIFLVFVIFSIVFAHHFLPIAPR